MKRYVHIFLAVLLVLTHASCMLETMTQDKQPTAEPGAGSGSLARLPFKEAWYGTYFQEDKIGYSHFKVGPSGSNFVINTDSLIRLPAAKKTEEINMKETVTVRPDLTLLSFESKVKMNERNMSMSGKVKGNRLAVEITVDGEKLKRDYPIPDKCYHSSAVSFMPVLKGLKDGRHYSFSIFNAQEQSFNKVEQELTLVKGSPGPGGAIWKLKNHYGKTQGVSWLNKNGLTVLEKGSDGSLLTVLEDESSAKKFLEEKTSSMNPTLHGNPAQASWNITGRIAVYSL